MSLLAAEQLSAGYGGHPFIRDIDLHVDSGEIVALLGANGAGKTTTLLALAGEIPALGGTVTFRDRPTRTSLYRRARSGLGLITEERSVFMRLTVEENLRVGRGDRHRALEMFPELVPLRKRPAGLLSGGEQQILTLARALSRKTKVLLIDELSLGLAPLIVERLVSALRAAVNTGDLGIVLVEQHASALVPYIDRAYVLERGRVAGHMPAADVPAWLVENNNAYL